jgi:bisphosphoglycerate-dependent phosphoglycerate mutase
MKDRENVSGFKPHGFRYLGVPAHESKRWRINHVLLVGILSHEQPVVYLTDKLPSMEQVRQGKTRALDFFEEGALPSLRDGEDLYIVSKDDTIRMLGALRATKTCQKCHDAEIGDLLGAFSYTLRPAPKETNQER